MPDVAQALINKPRAHELMEQYDVDVMIGATPENVAYLSDYATWITRVYREYTTRGVKFQSFALLPKDEAVPPALLLPRLNYQSQWPSWIDDLYTWEGIKLPADVELDPEARGAPEIGRLRRYQEEAKKVDSPSDALITALQDRDLESATMAVDLEGIHPETLSRLETAFPDATILHGGEFFRLVRAVKSGPELAVLRRAAEINEQAIASVLDAMAVGVTETELDRTFRAAVAERGADAEFFNIHAGKRAGMFWEPSDRPLQAGDLAWMDGGCVYEMYHADTGTCAIVEEEPTSQMAERYRICEAGLEAALDAVRPGAKASDVTRALYDALHDEGVPEGEEFGFGHAIGLESRDPPLIQPPYSDYDDPIVDGSTDLTLEPNMVLNVEVPYWAWNMGGLQVEQTVVVEPHGYDLLSHQERTLRVV